MTHESVGMRLKVILVTTRAALRHASGDAEQRRTIVDRGRELLDALEASGEGGSDSSMAEARAELDRLERG